MYVISLNYNGTTNAGKAIAILFSIHTQFNIINARNKKLLEFVFDSSGPIVCEINPSKGLKSTFKQIIYLFVNFVEHMMRRKQLL